MRDHLLDKSMSQFGFRHQTPIRFMGLFISIFARED